MLLCYDFEVFSKTPKGEWCVVIVDLLTGEETHIVNDSEKMKAFYEGHKNYIWCGYNSKSYDTNILKAILLDIPPATMNDWLIEQDRKGFELDNRINKIKLYSFDIMYSRLFSLKRLEAYMGDSIVETDIPFDIDRDLTADEWKSVLYYCSHDVWESIKVMTKSKSEFFAYWNLLKEFNLSLQDLGKTKAQLTADILGCERTEFNDEWDLPEPNYECKIRANKNVYDWFFKDENHGIGNKLELDIDGVPHTYGWGGSHSARANVFEKTNLLCADIVSFYPSMILEHDLLSRTPRSPERYREIYNTRVALKHAGKKKEQAPYKICLNATFGASADKYNKLYDPRQAHRICLTGQIFILDLEEQLLPYCRLLQSNTDAVYVMYDEKDKEKILSICKEWERRTKMSLEYDDYPNARIFQRDVNSYLIIPEGHSSKGKGALLKSQSELDYDCPILNKAITAFFKDGIEPLETVFENKNFIDFQKVFVKSSKYRYVYLGAVVEEQKVKNPETNRMNTVRTMVSSGKVLTDKTYRVFASTEESGTLYKSWDYGKNLAKFAGAPENCFIENGDIKGKSTDDYPQLDKLWYVNTIWEKILQFYFPKSIIKSGFFEKVSEEKLEEMKDEVREKVRSML